MRYTAFVLFLAVTLAACGQQQTNGAFNDSLAVVHAPWIIDTIDGLVLKTVQFSAQELFGANQYMAVLEVPRKSQYMLAFTHEQRRTLTSIQGKRNHAVAAVNGSFFDMERHNPICYLRIGGRDVGGNTPGTDKIHRKYYQYGSMSLRKGRPYIFRTDSARCWETSLPDSNIMTAGPLLILDNEIQPQRNDRTFITQRHNRTAIGVKADGTVLLFVVDGRMKESAGMTMTELSKTLQWLGCKDALNLDGGGSTTMWLKPLSKRIKAQAPNGLVNHPSDNGKYDHQGERAVSNCVIVVHK